MSKFVKRQEPLRKSALKRISLILKETKRVNFVKRG